MIHDITIVECARSWEFSASWKNFFLLLALSDASRISSNTKLHDYAKPLQCLVPVLDSMVDDINELSLPYPCYLMSVAVLIRRCCTFVAFPLYQPT